MTETLCRKYTDSDCEHYPECSCMGVDRSVKYPFQDNPLCNDCATIDACGSLGCAREKETMTDRCNNCNTTDTCNVAGCIGDKFAPCNDCSDLFNCDTFGCLNAEVDAIIGDTNPECCGDPSDCNEPCSIGYVGQTDDYLPGLEEQLDGRNESPVNRHGCSYVDCGCEVPCTSDPQKIVNITINGTLNGDINL